MGIEETVVKINLELSGKVKNELCTEFCPEVSDKSKSIFNSITQGLIKKYQIEKADFTIKSIRVEQNGKIREHMSFPAFSFSDLNHCAWEESDLYKTFSNKQFLLFIYKNNGADYAFYKIMQWKMPADILNSKVREVWEVTKNCIETGTIIKEYKNGKYVTNFPGSKFNNVCHVRSHDSKGIDNGGYGNELPVPDKLTGLTNYTKQCFWIDKSYFESIID